MQELEKRLKKELQQNMKVKIMGSGRWSIPIHSIEVEFRPVKRTKMDVLMKIMLISFQKAEIAKVEELSEILLVEQLFIEDLIKKMTRTGLVEKRDNLYRLTGRGYQQLENGIFEEEQDNESKTVLYSSCHEKFLNGVLKEVPAEVEELEIYRHVKEGYLDEELAFLDEALIHALRTSGAESVEGDVQTVVSEIVSTTELYIDDIPCLEFILYNTEKDIMYARVWNTLLEQWDETLENQLNEKERIQWRERYLHPSR